MSTPPPTPDHAAAGAATGAATGVPAHATAGGAPGAEQRPGHYRWSICALLFFATTINYMDRQVLGLLAPLLQAKFHWSQLQYGYIIMAFQAAYAIGLLFMGRLIDRIGTRLGYAISIAIWSLSAMGHALANTVMEFGVARFCLGLGESGNFPAAIKAVAEWFPKKERALATGIFNSGTNVGATIAPLVVPWIAVHWGWRFGFLFTGFFSAAWVICWLVIYRLPERHQRVRAAELAYIRSDPPEPQVRVPWARLLPHRETWAFILGKFLTDPVWWFLLFWLPKYLNQKEHLSLLAMGLPLVVIYNAASVGSIFGGWLPERLLARGWPLNRARKTAMLVCALAVVPIFAVGDIRSVWGQIALLSLAAAAHQGWSANLFTLVSDLFPRPAVASVVGIGGFAGAIGGMLIAGFTGWVLQTTNSYVPVFTMAAGAYVVSWLIIQRLTPRLEPAKLSAA